MYKILIIDDDRDMQLILSDTLALEGYETIVAGDGKRALKEIRAQSLDLVLLDVRLPGMNGLKVLEKIKKINRQLIVIMFTGYGDIRDAVQAMKLGAYDYMTKPFDNGEIVANIKNALHKLHLKNKRLSAPLSRREKEVIRWLIKGKSSWEVSEILDISERTVNFHINNIMQKLEAVTRTQAVARAIELGLV